jgi:peptide deformylase
MIRFISLLYLSFLLLIGCSIQKTTFSKKASPTSFTSLEIERIRTGNTKGPMRLFTLNHKEDSILLRQKSTDITLPTQDSIVDLFVERLLQTVIDSNNLGVGIAAPQVGILKNIIYVQRFDKDKFPFEVYYNPRIIQYSKMKQPCLEGCLSIPGVVDTTQNRSYAILLEHQLRSGEWELEMIEEFTAVIFQHEIDHLNGILFVDHLKKESSN